MNLPSTTFFFQFDELLTLKEHHYDFSKAKRIQKERGNSINFCKMRQTYLDFEIYAYISDGK